MTTRRMFASAAALMMAALLAVSPAVAGGDDVRMRASLNGPRLNGMTPSGSADFRSEKSRSRLNVQVEDVRVAPGTVLDVILDGNRIGGITVDALTLGGEIEFNSNDGDMVPAARKGSVVVVKLGDQALLAGVF